MIKYQNDEETTNKYMDNNNNYQSPVLCQNGCLKVSRKYHFLF